LIPTLLLITAWHSYSIEYVLAGHYLFPVLLPVLTIFAWGWVLLVGRFPLSGMWLAALPVGLIVMNWQARSLYVRHTGMSPFNLVLEVSFLLAVAALTLALWRSKGSRVE